MGTESFVQPPPNSSGLKVRTVEVTRADGVVVEMQAVVLVDPNTTAAQLGITLDGFIQMRGQFDEDMLRELRRIARGLELLLDQEIALQDAENF